MNKVHYVFWTLNSEQMKPTVHMYMCAFGEHNSWSVAHVHHKFEMWNSCSKCSIFNTLPVVYIRNRRANQVAPYCTRRLKCQSAWSHQKWIQCRSCKQILCTLSSDTLEYMNVLRNHLKNPLRFLLKRTPKRMKYSNGRENILKEKCTQNRSPFL